LISDNDTVRNSVIEVFTKLWDQGKGIDEALNTAISNIDANDEIVAWGARKLFNKLSRNAELRLETISPDDEIGMEGLLALFKKLFAHGVGFEEAKNVITCCQKSPIDWIVRKLRDALTNAEAKAKAQEAAFYKQAVNDFASGNSVTKENAIKSFKKLWFEGKGIDQALDIAASNTAASREIFNALISHARFCFEHNNLEGPAGKKAALAIFKKLLAHGEGLGSAHLASIHVKSDDKPDIQAVVKDLSDAVAAARTKREASKTAAQPPAQEAAEERH
jgi:hypothetical protein